MKFLTQSEDLLMYYCMTEMMLGWIAVTEVNFNADG